MATASKIMKGFGVTCPYCNEEGTVNLDLNDLKVCRCNSCDEDFSPADAVTKAMEELKRWQAVQRWTEMAAAAFDAAFDGE